MSKVLFISLQIYNLSFLDPQKCAKIVQFLTVFLLKPKISRQIFLFAIHQNDLVKKFSKDILNFREKLVRTGNQILVDPICNSYAIRVNPDV